MDPPGQHCQSTEWSLHCSMLSFRLKGRWTHKSTLSEHRVISSLFNVVIQTQRQTDTPQSTLSEHRVISSLFNVVIQTQRQKNPLQNTVRAQSDLFTVQCCHSDSKADGNPWSTLSEQSYIFTVQCCHSDSKADGPHSQHCQSRVGQHCQSTEWFLHCSMLSFRFKGRWTPPDQYCQNTEWSLHCSMLSFRFKGRWTPYVQNTARAQSDLFTVQCCHSDSKTDGPPWSTLSEQRYLFTVQCCHSDSKADGPHSQHCQSTEWSLPCSMLSFRLKGRWTHKSTLSEHRVISSLFNVVIQTQRHMDPPGQMCQSRVISSLFNVVIQTQRQMEPLCAKHSQSTEWSLHSSILSFRLKGRWTPWSTLSEHRVISSLFNVVIQTQRQMATRVNTVRAQSDLFTVQCCHSDSKAEGPPQSTLSEHRVISSLFNVVIETQRQMDLTSQHCQSTEWSLHCSMLSLRLKGRLPPQSTLSEHRVISSLFNVFIQT